MFNLYKFMYGYLENYWIEMPFKIAQNIKDTFGFDLCLDDIEDLGDTGDVRKYKINMEPQLVAIVNPDSISYALPSTLLKLKENNEIGFERMEIPVNGIYDILSKVKTVEIGNQTVVELRDRIKADPNSYVNLGLVEFEPKEAKKTRKWYKLWLGY
jgi:hypothetical protein